MTGIEDAALLAVVAIGSALGASALPRASWPRRSPAAAILLWQGLGLASGLAAVGTLIGLGPAGRPGRPAARRGWFRPGPAVRPRRGGRRAADPGRGPAGLPGGRGGAARLAVLG